MKRSAFLRTLLAPLLAPFLPKLLKAGEWSPGCGFCRTCGATERSTAIGFIECDSCFGARCEREHEGGLNIYPKWKPYRQASESFDHEDVRRLYGVLGR
jgi:hypothetical protein